MYFVCECGAKFNDEQEGARDHVLEEHLDLVETEFEDKLDELSEEDPSDDRTDTEIYEEAVEAVVEELLDEFED